VIQLTGKATYAAMSFILSIQLQAHLTKMRALLGVHEQTDHLPQTHAARTMSYLDLTPNASVGYRMRIVVESSIIDRSE